MNPTLHRILHEIIHTNIGNAVQGLEETFLLARLAFRLLYLLGLGWRWNVQLWRLMLYALLLLPGFIQVLTSKFPSFCIVKEYPLPSLTSSLVCACVQ